MFYKLDHLLSPGICLDRLKFQTLPAFVRKSFTKTTQLTETKQRPTTLLRPCPESNGVCLMSVTLSQKDKDRTLIEDHQEAIKMNF